MALKETELKLFLIELIKASQDLNSKKIIFTSEWIYYLPTQSLRILDTMLHTNYDIPTGWNGYGEEDLNKLVDLGHLKKLSEIADNSVTFQKNSCLYD